MASKLAVIECTFIVEPDVKTWTRVSEFEKDLGDFFAANGLEAEVIETVGGIGRRVMYVKPIEDKLDAMRKSGATEPQKGPQQALKDVMKKAQGASLEKKKGK